MPISITNLDHLVITVKDLSKTMRFYGDILGMKIVQFGQDRIAFHFGNQKINIHELNSELEPKAINSNVGTADLCFITSTSILRVMKILKENNIDIIEGPVEKVGALGKINSIYIRDPDSNLIELSNYIAM